MNESIGMCRPSGAPCDGFTLLEVLIAASLLGMLTIVLFGGLRFGTRAWQAAETSNANTDKVLSVQLFLTETVSAAYPMFVRLSPQDAHVEFDGNQERVRFLAPAKSLRGALEWVSIGTETLNGVRILGIWTKLELGTGERPRLAAVLLRGLKSFNVEYFGSYAPRDRPSWRHNWKGALMLPALVRMRATFVDGRIIWPELTIATHVSVDQACVYDELTNYCQGRI